MLSETRRNFLTAASVTLLFLSSSALVVARVGLPDRVTAATRSFLRIFKDISAPRAVGAQYLETHPRESDVDLLVTEIFGNAPPTDPRELASRLGERCKADFHNDDIVILDGWILARSEARACALTSLL